MSRNTPKTTKTNANPKKNNPKRTKLPPPIIPTSKKLTALRWQDPYLEREQAAYIAPLPSREFMISLIEAEGVPLDADILAERLGIFPEEIAVFHRRLRAMVRDGELLQNRAGALCIAAKLDLLAAKVEGHPDGFGFAIVGHGQPDLVLDHKEMQKVLHGDQVLVRASGTDYKGRLIGKIIEVTERANLKIVARLINDHGVWLAIPENKRISQDILITPDGIAGAAAEQIVVVELISQPNKHAKPIGQIVEILGNYDDSGMEIEIALRKHNLPYIFPEAALQQAKNTPAGVSAVDYGDEDGVAREDLRTLPLVTIDGETARDFDDAVFAQPVGAGWRLVVAIADVSHYVRPNDALDVEAIERGNSVYFPRRVIPMLPEALSNGICSLNPQVERLCMVCDMQIDAEGVVTDYRFYPAVMCSIARLTYTQVADALGETLYDAHGKVVIVENNPITPAILPHLQHLNGVFHTLLKARKARGAVDFETKETQIIFNQAGKIQEIIPTTRNDAHRIIEECMLAANVCSANFLIHKKHPSLYRVHESPKAEKLDSLRAFLSTCGITLTGGQKVQAKDYANTLQQIKTRPDADLLQTLLLRSMQQAVYSPDNAGHFGLGYEAYTHFTSPIRRYPDLLVHRAIKACLAKKHYKPKLSWEALGLQCSGTERRADEASRDVINWLKCFYMKDKIGQEFTGTISSVTGFGMFILLDDLYIEGLVHIAELGADYFTHNKIQHTLTGERTGKVFRLADRVSIKVARVDMNSSKLDFILLANTPSSKKAATSEDKPAAAKVRKPRKKKDAS